MTTMFWKKEMWWRSIDERGGWGNVIERGNFFLFSRHLRIRCKTLNPQENRALSLYSTLHDLWAHPLLIWLSMKLLWETKTRSSDREGRRDESLRMLDRRKDLGSERGSSFAEFLLITLVFGIIIAGALGFMTTQQNAFKEGANQLATVQSLRYGYQALEIDLSTLGSNVPAGQPSLVLAGEDVIAFTGDYRSNLTNDVSALYIDPDAPDEMVQVPGRGIKLPNSAYSWPDTVYEAGGGTQSLAELIIFFFDSDNTTARTDDYVLCVRSTMGRPKYCHETS